MARPPLSQHQSWTNSEPFSTHIVPSPSSGLSPLVLTFQPHVSQVLAYVLTGGHVPALDVRRGGDDPVVPEDRNGIGLRQRPSLELSDDTRPLALIGRHRLADIERIEVAVGRGRVISRRKIP